MKFIIGFLVTAVFCGITVWLGGYNFDTREFLVGYGFVCCCLISAIGGKLLTDVWK